MSSRLRITRRWSDEDILELTFEVCDGTSTFVNNAYDDLDWLATAASELKTFAPQVHGGLYDLKAGRFGPEVANGAFFARFHFPRPGRLHVSTHQQSDFFEFKGHEVASEARLYLKSEPALLDRFIDELAAMSRGEREDATLEGA